MGHRMGSQLLHLVSRPSLCQLQPGQQVAVHAAGRVSGQEVQDAEQSVLLRIFAIMQALLNILKVSGAPVSSAAHTPS